jgi:hypothetical protein
MRKLLFATLGGLLAPIVLASPVSAVSPVVASGFFTVQINLASITLAPAAGGNCVLTVNGVSRILRHACGHSYGYNDGADLCDLRRGGGHAAGHVR